jgi:hypothetical protein
MWKVWSNLSISRRRFLQLFVATTIAISTDSKALALDTSASETAIQIAPPIAMTADTQFLWIMAQKFYDFAVFMAAQYQVPIRYLYGSEVTVQSYYVTLLREYHNNGNRLGVYESTFKSLEEIAHE